MARVALVRGARVLVRLRKRKNDKRVSRFGIQLAASAGGDHHVLLSVHFVRRGHGIAAGLEMSLP